MKTVKFAFFTMICLILIACKKDSTQVQIIMALQAVGS